MSKKLLLINTGGTFSSVPSEKGLAPGIDLEEIMRTIGPIGEGHTFELKDYASLDSANITPEDWVAIANLVAAAREDCDGVVIIHGTDSMSYTSSMLSFMLQNIEIPVILTGSQLPLRAPLTDAIDNLRCAITAGLSGMLRGVYTVFHQKLILGCRTSKVRTVSFNAFESVNYPLIGEFNAFGMQVLKEPLRRASFQLSLEYSENIAVLKIFPGMHADIFRYLYDKGCEGVFVEAFGLGGVPFLHNNILEEIDRASSKGMSILVGSQCRYEGSNLDVYETGLRVQESGGIPVFDMTQEATVTKLMWALGRSKAREDVRKTFFTNYVDEVTLPRLR